jgi:transcriptional regulator with XRE-family HTH domain
MYDKDIKELNKIIKDLGMTRNQFINLGGIGRERLARRLNGKGILNLELALMIAKATGQPEAKWIAHAVSSLKGTEDFKKTIAKVKKVKPLKTTKTKKKK